MNNTTQQLGGVAGELTKAGPPIAVSAATIAGITIQDWVLILTAIYTVLQIVLTTIRSLRK